MLGPRQTVKIEGCEMVENFKHFCVVLTDIFLESLKSEKLSRQPERIGGARCGVAPP
jgi:hypothetical protein